MTAVVATGWIVAGIAGLLVFCCVSFGVSALAGRTIDSKAIDELDELEAARRRHHEQEQRRDESGGGAA